MQDLLDLLGAGGKGGTRQVTASIPLQARMDGRAVLPGLPVPATGL